MELQEFVEKFAGLFDDTDEELFSADTVFQDLEEWGSLTVMSIIAFAKTEFNKNINAKEIRSCETVEDLYNFLKNDR